MKLFGRTGGYYLFWTGLVYIAVCLYIIGVEPFCSVEVVQAVWILILSLPFVIPPFGRWLNMSIDWDKKMFDWFKNYRKPEGSIAEDMNKVMDDMNNVVKFPEVKTPYIVPDAPEPAVTPAKILYRIGVTDQSRVAFSMGQMEITMNKKGCQQMIDQLELFMSQLEDEDE
jgi:hypothetical protein